ncbi:META domain-containing protein [Stappia indica]|uniref:META domain-containing protein n=1 Tax=Stappia indica TaxID=538381 RepID=UPI001CD1DACF|nr:META domain-containing protein [Stappia indica]MCA1299492.1 YbaY family lipoprotein [Stappia indica]
MRHPITGLLSAALTASLLFSALPAAATEVTVTGALTYRQRVALPPDSMVKVELREISIADQAAPLLAEYQYQADGRQVPLPFEFTIDDSAFQPGHRYAVQGRITQPDGQLLWTTDEVHSVDPDKRENDLGMLMLVRVEDEAALPAFTATGNEPGWSLKMAEDRFQLSLDYGSNTTSAPLGKLEADDTTKTYRTRTEDDRDLAVTITDALCHDDMSGMPYPMRVTLEIGDRSLNGCGGHPADLLTGAAWTVEDIGSAGIIDFSSTTLEFTADGRLYGRSGCNRYNAGYQLTGESLTIGAAGVTNMACAPALMTQEAAFLEILSEVQRFDITQDGALRLIAGDGRTILARR